MGERDSLFYLIRPAAGGMRGHLRDLLAHFGEICRLHLASPDGDLAVMAERSGGGFHPLPLEGDLRPREDLRVLCRLYRVLARIRPALLHTHGFKAALVGGAAARLSRTPLLVTVHNFPAHPAGFLLPAFRSLAASRGTRFIAVSRALAGELDRWGADPARVTVIHNGIDAGRFDGAARRRRLSGERAVIGTVARLAPQKGVAVFLQAAAILAARYPAIAFRVVGDGPERPALEAAAQKLGLGERVEFRGYREDLAAELEQLDLFVLPSLSEGLSITLLEALAAGCPVAACRCGGIPEIVEEGVTGLLTPPNDPDTLAGRVEELLRRPTEARRMAGAGREKVRRDFSREMMLHRTAEVYREMGALPTG